MKQTKQISIGLAGCGIVGTGVLAILKKRRQFFFDFYGVDFVVKTIFVKDTSKKRNIDEWIHCLTSNPKGLDECDIVVELIGGEFIAKDIVFRALKNNQDLVTANKALLATYWKDIAFLLKNSQSSFRYEASVAGAIPILKTIQDSLAANHIQGIKGIINGTTNYILSKMQEDSKEFSVVLKQAQDLGFAEADPTFDIDGIDTAHKLSILLALSYGVFVPWRAFYVEGIRNIKQEDIKYADELGYSIKLLGILKDHPDSIEARVHPVLLRHDHILADVSGANNALNVSGSFSGDILLYGQGAGSYPTASAVVGDILNIMRSDGSQKSLKVGKVQKSLLPIENIETRYFLKLMVENCPGILAQIVNLLAHHSISIASILQKESLARMKTLVIVTESCQEQDIQTALKYIVALDQVNPEDPTLFRIEDE